MNRTNSIALDQRYVETIMENPRTSYRSRKAVVDYVFSHPEKFVPLCDSTGDPSSTSYATGTWRIEPLPGGGVLLRPCSSSATLC